MKKMDKECEGCKASFCEDIKLCKKSPYYIEDKPEEFFVCENCYYGWNRPAADLSRNGWAGFVMECVRTDTTKYKRKEDTCGYWKRKEV